MRALFIKLYGASLIAIVFSIIATFYLLWYQWQPENNHQLTRFSAAAVKELVIDLKRHTQGSEKQKLKLLENTLPYTAQELKKINKLSDKLRSSISLLFKRDIEFAPRESKLLEQNEIVYHNDSDAKRAYITYDQERVLEVELTRLKGSANQWMASLIYLVHYAHDDLDTKLKRVASLLTEAERPEIIPLSKAGLSKADLARLYLRPQATSSLTSSSYLIQILHYPNGALEPPLVISYLVQLSPTLLFPPVIFVPLISLFLAIALWFVLAPYARRSCLLSDATQRFSEGDLQARALLTGHSPIDRIAQQFDQAADHVVGLLKMHKGLLQGVAHELRTPISKLYFYGELLSTERDPDRSQDLLDDFNKNVQELSDLTSELLNSHRYERGQLNLDLRPINLSQVLREVCRDAIDLQMSIELSLIEAEDLFVLGEPKAIKRMINNLINNASQFGREQVRVSLTLNTEAENLQSTVDRLVLSVEDDGDGVPTDKREEIFIPFSRLDESRNRDTGGVGLGLSICQKITTALGGEIYVTESAELGGARFNVELPRTLLQSSES